MSLYYIIGFRKLIFIGPIASNKVPKGGDQFKNRLLLEILKSLKINLTIFDTSNNFGRVKLLIFLIFERFMNIDSLLVSSSSISAYRLFKKLSERNRRKTTYFAMGGALPQIIKTNNFATSIYKSLKDIVVQGETIKGELYNLGLYSKVLNNFKHRTYKGHRRIGNTKELRLVFVSRITESKGVLTILEALDRLAKESISVTFFGPCDTEMNEAILKNSFANYGGYLDFYSNPMESYSKLSEYDAMVFPTKWHGEGFPGVFLDAFMAGLPVICSDWNMNAEVIQNGYNGLVLKKNTADDLIDAINTIDRDRNLLNELSKNSLSSFDNYDFETAKAKIKEILS